MREQSIKFRHSLLLTFALLLFSTVALAQIRGKVTDANGDGLPGVTVLEKNTQNGTITDFDGNYQLKLQKNQNAILVFSFMGMETQEVAVNTNAKVDVVLIDDSKKLEEVVVVAYGTQKKVSVTGAITSVSTKDLKQSPSANFLGAMAGRLPGLVTVQSSGQPGAEGIEMYLRGASTTNGTQPLVLVDGIPRDIITSIDPNEIESVSILKDASATAVFGVRGANGVILITSKRGSTATPKLSVSGEFGLQDLTRMPEVMDSWEFASLRRQAYLNDGVAVPAQFSEDAIAKFKAGTDPVMYPNTNWFNIMLKPNAPMNRYNVNVSGGGDRVKYFINASYTNQGSMFKTEPKEKLGYDPAFKMDRYNFRTNLDIKMNNWITSSIDLAGYIESVNGSQFAASTGISPIINIYSQKPIKYGPLTVDGSGLPSDRVVGTYGNQNTAYGGLNRSGYENITRSNLNSSLAFDFDLGWITKGLKSKVSVSFDSKSTAEINGKKDHLVYYYDVIRTPDPNDPTKTIDAVSFTPEAPEQFFPLTLSKSASYLYKMNFQWRLNYNRTFGKHDVTGMLLAQRDNNEAASGSSENLLPYNMLGYAARVTYGFDDRYLLEGNIGYNGSEQFAAGKTRFGVFPAGSLGWVVSNEEFLKDNPIITKLKFRASYGKVGNDKLGSDRFLYLDNVAVGSGGFSPSLGLGKTIKEDLIGNPFITWETAYKQNYGVELSLLKELSINADMFFEKREDILLKRGTVPALQGLPLDVVPKANIGRVNNKGYELELIYSKIINKDFTFRISANYNYNENKVLELDEPVYDPSYAYPYRRTGYSLSQEWGYLIDWNSPGKGYYTSQEEIDNSGLTFDGVQPKPGDFVYKDISGDKAINDRDKAPIGYGSVPRVTYGANFSVSYKGFDFSALIQGTGRSSDYYSSYGVFEHQKDGFFTDFHRNSWTKERYESGAKITYPRLTAQSSGSYSTKENDFFIMDKSYVRLKNAEIGYNVPKKFVKKLEMQNVRLYVNGQNIFVWDKLPVKNFDPEQKTASSHPILRVFNFGANIVF